MCGCVGDALYLLLTQAANSTTSAGIHMAPQSSLVLLHSHAPAVGVAHGGTVMSPQGEGCTPFTEMFHEGDHVHVTVITAHCWNRSTVLLLLLVSYHSQVIN